MNSSKPTHGGTSLKNDERNVVTTYSTNPSVKELYGNANDEKFYFQQRRGRIDLRQLMSLDLERIVREVDIDILQNNLENITFSNLREEDLQFMTDPHVIKLFRASQLIIEYLLYVQENLASKLTILAEKYSDKKSSLTKKRRELAELRESSKHLRTQVATKKESVAALEALLKETGRGRDKRREKTTDNIINNNKIGDENERKNRNSHGNDQEDMDINGIENKRNNDKANRNAIDRDITTDNSKKLHIFVAGPEGLCVEFHVDRLSTIEDLIVDVRKAFISKREAIRNNQNNKSAIKIIYQGRILVETDVIKNTGVRDGDTVIAVLPTPANDDDYTGGEKRGKENKSSLNQNTESATATAAANTAIAEMISALAHQQDSMKEIAAEMRYD